MAPSHVRVFHSKGSAQHCNLQCLSLAVSAVSLCWSALTWGCAGAGDRHLYTPCPCALHWGDMISLKGSFCWAMFQCQPVLIKKGVELLIQSSAVCPHFHTLLFLLPHALQAWYSVFWKQTPGKSSSRMKGKFMSSGLRY